MHPEYYYATSYVFAVRECITEANANLGLARRFVSSNYTALNIKDTSDVAYKFLISDKEGKCLRDILIRDNLERVSSVLESLSLSVWYVTYSTDRPNRLEENLRPPVCTYLRSNSRNESLFTLRTLARRIIVDKYPRVNIELQYYIIQRTHLELPLAT